MNMFIVKKDMCTKCRKHIALTYSTKKKRLINIAFELVVRFHAQAIRPRSEDDNVSCSASSLARISPVVPWNCSTSTPVFSVKRAANLSARPAGLGM